MRIEIKYYDRSARRVGARCLTPRILWTIDAAPNDLISAVSSESPGRLLHLEDNVIVVANFFTPKTHFSMASNFLSWVYNLITNEVVQQSSLLSSPRRILAAASACSNLIIN